MVPRSTQEKHMNALHWMMLAVVVALVSALIGLAWAAWDMRNVDLTPRK